MFASPAPTARSPSPTSPRRRSTPNKLPKGMEPGLYETATFTNEFANFPNGCHVCEVEIDPDTGAPDDRPLCGGRRLSARVLNPLLLEGPGASAASPRAWARR